MYEPTFARRYINAADTVRMLTPIWVGNLAGALPPSVRSPTATLAE